MGPFRPIWRERVVRRIRQAAAWRVVSIIAPGGFGKTVALRHFLSTEGGVVLLDVPAYATTFPPFIRSFAEALGSVVPTLPSTIGTALESLRSSTRKSAELAAWVAKQLGSRRLLIALDDLHVGDDDLAISQFVHALVEATDDSIRFVFSSRTAANIPIASWIAYGRCDLPVDAADLKLTLDEARAFAGHDADPKIVAELFAYVDGWPAAFQLAVRAMSRAPNLSIVNAPSQEIVYRYLAEQIWTTLDNRLRSFLRSVAFLPSIDVAVCAAWGYDEPVLLIEELHVRGVFIAKRSNEVYELHELFRDFVRHEVRREGSAALKDGWRRAAEALLAAGRPADAFDAVVRSAEPRWIVDFLVRFGLDFADRGELYLIQRALDALRPDDGASTSVIRALRGICAEAQGRTADAKAHFRAVLTRVDILEARQAVDVMTKIVVFHARYDRTDALDAIAHLRQRQDLDNRQRALLLDSEAVALAFTDRLDEAVLIIRRALELVEDATIDADARSKVHANAALIFYHARDDKEMRRYAASAIEGAEACGNHRRSAAVWMNLYVMHAAAGRLVEAVRCTKNSAAQAERAGDFEYLGIALRAQLKVAAERGDDREAERLRHALAGVPSTSRGGMIYAIIADALVLPPRGQLREACELLQQFPESDLVVVQNRTRYALLGLISAAANAHAEAEAALERYAAFAGAESGNRAILARTNALSDRWVVLARLLLHGVVTVDGARLKAAPLSRDLQGLDRAILGALHGERDQFQRGLEQLERADRGGYARFVDAVCAPLWRPAPGTGMATVPLTEAERRIVRCLAEGLSNQAIADRYQRSVHTVRTQVAALLAKLGASSRGEAAAIARRTGLLDDAL
ncbi:MAG: hypothetical protein JOZ58_27295 [Acetobacteraceae bacterium]|nr:hypothetical protein [Acetobacteraceae bacterium]